MNTIFVVDDMAIVREPIAAVLRSQGYRALCAAGGQEALAMIRIARPQLVLFDLAISDMDGVRFLRALRADPLTQRTPVIVLTALSALTRDRVMEVGKLGIRDFVLKGQFSLDDLLARVQRCLEGTATEAAQDIRASLPEPAHCGGGNSGHGEAGAHPAPLTPIAQASPAALATASSAIAPSSDPADAGDSGQAGCLKDIKPILSRSQIRDFLDNCGELKAMSPSVSQVLSLSRNPDSSIEKIAKAVKQDHALALKVLKIANSIVYLRGEPVESVQKAVTRIGLAQTQQMVMNIGVIEAFSSGANQHLNLNWFWEHSIATGLICAQVTRAVGGSEEEIDSAFTTGLLHDAGRLVYLEVLGENYLRVLETARRLQLPLEQVESRMLLVNHADAMDRILHTWRFPKHLVDPIAFHHLSADDMRRMSPRTLREASVLALANRLAHALLLGDSGNDTIYPINEFVQALSIKAEVIEAIRANVPGQTDDIKFAMLSRGHHASWDQKRDQVLNRMHPSANPLFLSADPDLDAFRLTFEQLRRPGNADRPPNVAVLHLPHARERTALSDLLLAAESRAGVQTLPLLILSPTGELTLEASACADRQIVRLQTPVTTARLVDAVNGLCAGAAAGIPIGTGVA